MTVRPSRKDNTSTLASAVGAIVELFTAARAAGDTERNERLLLAYWEIGRVVRDIGDGQGRAPYGARVLDQLATELGQRLGRGFSSRNLMLMRALTSTWSRDRLDPRLSFSHYRALLAVTDPSRRDELGARAANERLPLASLRLLVARESDANEEQGPRRLQRPRGEAGLVKVVAPPPGRAADEPRWLDLGFGVQCRFTGRGAEECQPGTVARLVDGARPRLVPVAEVGTPSWIYAAQLERVVDGDTLIAKVELGLGLVSRQRMRLRGVDAAELDSPGGAKAHEHLKRRLAGCAPLVLRTHAIDRYHRYVVDVLAMRRERDVARILAEGIFINEELIEKGQAEQA